jgi:DNA-binding MarR family transcriptional regulator
MDILEKQKYIFGSLFLAANKLQAVCDKHLGEDGMTTKQWFLTVVLSQFKDNPPTLSEVAEVIGSSRQNVKQLALKLEEKDFLRIEKDEEDARATRLRLTDKSQEYWDKRQDQDEDFIRELFKDFSREEIQILGSSFKKLLDKMEKMDKVIL